MTDEGEPPVADLAAEIMSADRPGKPATDGARNRSVADFGIRAWLVITLVAFVVTPLIVVILSQPE